MNRRQGETVTSQKPKSRIRKISVIIPVCNEAGYIRATLESLASARETLDLEVIVSDDGSSDNTLDQVGALADLVVRAGPGQRTGAGAARNRGAAKAEGRVLVFLDADIRVRRPLDFFSKMEKAFSSGRLIAATSRLAVEPSQAGILEKIVFPIQDLLIWAENLAGVHVSGGWCQMVDQEAFYRVNGYNERLTVSQDVDLFKRLGRIGRTRLLPGLLVFESPRRYREMGLIRTYLIRIVNSLAVLMGLQPPAKSYRSQRPEFHG